MSVVYTDIEFKDLVEEIKKVKKFSFAYLWLPDESMGGFAISLNIKSGYYIPIFHFLEKTPLDACEVIYTLSELFRDPEIKVLFFDSFDTIFFLRNNGIRISGRVESIQLLLHILDVNKSLDELADDFRFSEFKVKKDELESQKSIDSIGEYLIEITKIVIKSRNYYVNNLSKEQNVLYRRDNIIMKLLADMSFCGIDVKKAMLQECKSELVEEVEFGVSLRTHYNMLTSTGRVYTAKPNLQNIPKDSQELNAFIVPEGFQIVFMDYHQIELRVLAFYSEDPLLVESIKNGKDLHSVTASMLFNKEDITSEERKIGKFVNFSALYGSGPNKLSERIKTACGIDVNGSRLIKNFYSAYGEVTKFKKDVQEVLEESGGSVVNCFGRTRTFKDITSDDEAKRQRAIRQGFNFVIQSTASDLFKMAMAKIDKFLQGRHTRTRMVLQVHDEIIFYWSIDELDLIDQVRNIAENVFPDIQLKVNVEISKTSMAERSLYEK